MKEEKTPQVAICQLPLFKGTREELFADLIKRDRELQIKEADLVLYPWSYFGVGYGSSQDLLSTGNLFFHGWLQKLASELLVPTILPFHLVTQEGTFVDIALLYQGNVTLLFTGDMELLARPEAAFEIGSVAFCVADMDFGIAFDEASLEVFTDGRENVDAIIYIPANGLNLERGDYGGLFSYVAHNLEGVAKKGNAFFINVNGCGLMQDIIFSGTSYAMTPSEDLLYVAPFCEPSVALVKLSDEPAKKAAVLPESTETFSMFPYPFLVRALQDFVYQGSFRGAEVLLTGDLASSLACTLAVDALGPKNVSVVCAPLSSNERNASMEALIDALGVQVEKLTPEELQLCKTYDETRIPFLAGAFAFERARKKKFCRLTAEDQSALALGQDLDNFANADFAPFSEFLRTELRRQARERNKRNPVIPEACFSEAGLNYSGSRLYKIISDGFAKASDTFLNKWKAPSVLIDNVFYAYLDTGMSEEVLYAENPDIASFAPHILHVFKKYAFLRDKLPFSLSLSFPEPAETIYPIMGAWHHYNAQGITEDELRQEADAMGEEIVSKLEAFFSADAEVGKDFDAQQEMFDTFNDFVMEPISKEDDSFFGNGLMGDN